MFNDDRGTEATQRLVIVRMVFVSKQISVFSLKTPMVPVDSDYYSAVGYTIIGEFLLAMKFLYKLTWSILIVIFYLLFF